MLSIPLSNLSNENILLYSGSFFKMSNICNQSGKIQVTMMLWERSLNDRQLTSPSGVK